MVTNTKKDCFVVFILTIHVRVNNWLYQCKLHASVGKKNKIKKTSLNGDCYRTAGFNPSAIGDWVNKTKGYFL